MIRPADVPGAGGKRLVVDSNSTTATWTAPDIAARLTSPGAVNVGATLSCRIDVSNPGDLPAKDVVVADAVPDGLTYLGANPPAEVAGGQLRWQLGELGARQQRSIEVNFRAERQGSVSHCCEVTAAGGLKATSCAATTVIPPGASLPASPSASPLASSPPSASSSAGAPLLDVRITGPAQDTVAVGSQVTFEVSVTNRSQSPATNLRIKDRFDPGFEHKDAPGENAIEHKFYDLAAGETQRVAVEFRVAKPGRLCHVVEILSAGTVLGSAQTCIVAVGEAAPPTGAEPPKAAATTASLSLSVKTIGASQLVVGETARFMIEVTNKGAIAIRNAKLVDRNDAALFPTFATGGRHEEGGEPLTWIIDELPAGQAVRYEVQCRCDAAAAKACSRASVVLPDGGRVEDETCLEIRNPTPPPSATAAPPAPPAVPAAERLTLSVVGLINPVRVNKSLTYEIVVQNKDTASYRQLSVTAIVPDGMVPDLLGTDGPTAAKLGQHTVVFDSVPEVQAGGSLTYHVRVGAREAGAKKFRVEVRVNVRPNRRCKRLAPR